MICKINENIIHYTHYGNGFPVLCIHGFGVDHKIMQGCLEPVFEKHNQYRRIYIDLPGMGNSPPAKKHNQRR